MNLYEKILTSKYYYISKTNWLRPIWATILYICLFHIFNILSTAIILRFNIKSLSKIEFVSLWAGIGGLLIWLHYYVFLTKKSFADRLKQIKINSLKKNYFFHLIYELISIAYLCYALNIDWGYYFYLSLGLVGFYLINNVIISEMDEKTNANKGKN